MTIINRYSSLLTVQPSVIDKVNEGRWYHLGKRVFLIQTEKEVVEVALNCLQRFVAAFQQIFGINYFARILKCKKAEKITLENVDRTKSNQNDPEAKERDAFRALPVKKKYELWIKTHDEELKGCQEHVDKEIETEKNNRSGKQGPFKALILSRYEAKTIPHRYMSIKGTAPGYEYGYLMKLKNEGKIADFGQYRLEGIPESLFLLVKLVDTDLALSKVVADRFKRID